MADDDFAAFVGFVLAVIGAAAVIGIVSQAAASKNFKCPNCGTPVQRNTQYCPSCRTPLRWI